jgi:hypothetical protein
MLFITLNYITKSITNQEKKEAASSPPNAEGVAAHQSGREVSAAKISMRLKPCLRNVIISIISGVVGVGFLIHLFSHAEDGNKKMRDLRLIVGIFEEEDADFFNKVLTADDIIFMYGVKLKLLTKIKGHQIMISKQSIPDMERELERLGNISVDYINYNPEQWQASHTPREEIEDLPRTISKARAFANQKHARLSFITDHILLERYGKEISILVDVFGIQLQRYQRETLKEFREEAVRKVAIVRSGNGKVPIFLQLSLAPPKWEIVTRPNGEKVVVVARGSQGEKLSEPLKAEAVLEQIEAIKDLADGIALLYTEETRDEMKRLVLLLRQ